MFDRVLKLGYIVHVIHVDYRLFCLFWIDIVIVYYMIVQVGECKNLIGHII